MKRLRWVLWLPVFAVGVPLLGLGVPLAWVWIASQLQHGTSGIDPLPAFTLVLGVPATYLGLAALAARLSGRERAPQRRHDAWTRSLSAERHTPSATTPIENLFIATVVVVGIAAEVYALFFASPAVRFGP